MHHLPTKTVNRAGRHEAELAHALAKGFASLRVCVIVRPLRRSEAEAKTKVAIGF
jgi:hypothetical protein